MRSIDIISICIKIFVFDKIITRFDAEWARWCTGRSRAHSHFFRLVVLRCKRQRVSGSPSSGWTFSSTFGNLTPTLTPKSRGWIPNFIRKNSSTRADDKTRPSRGRTSERLRSRASTCEVFKCWLKSFYLKRRMGDDHSRRFHVRRRWRITAAVPV